MRDQKLRVSEIFASIQGEGAWSGTPSTFIRVSGCNLRCSWCDTKYASWYPEGPILTLDQILRQVECLTPNHVVLTGGEPMLFEPIEQLTKELKDRGYAITIETAGTVDRKVEADLLSISPKLANSTPEGEEKARHERARWRPQIVRDLIARYPHQLKFVVNPEKPKEIDEVKRALNEIDPPKETRIFLMPEGTDSATLHRRERLLAEICLQNDWRLSSRLHIHLYGNERGR